MLISEVTADELSAEFMQGFKNYNSLKALDSAKTEPSTMSNTTTQTELPQTPRPTMDRQLIRSLMPYSSTLTDCVTDEIKHQKFIQFLNSIEGTNKYHTNLLHSIQARDFSASFVEYSTTLAKCINNPTLQSKFINFLNSIEGTTKYQ